MGIFMRQRKAGEPLTVVGDGTQRRDFTHVMDVVDANLKASICEVPEEMMGDIFNVGSGINHSIMEIAKSISDKISFIPHRNGEMKETLADNSKIKIFMGWEPKHDVEKYIQSALTK
jgi:UDP-glucose 4-epimerase